MAAELNKEKSTLRQIMTIPVIVAALGYFVDIYDLVLFSIVREASLIDIGLSGKDLTDKGILLLNTQMIGMLLGGIFWGIWGDKKGRLSILFGSIFLYSAANIANGFVNSVESYAIWRFIAGLGLAGELGAGITLVVEVLPKHLRGYGTMVVASVGVSGAILAGFIAEAFQWRTAYFIGGGLGLMLLILRISVYESGLFEKTRQSEVARGDFLSLFSSFTRLKRYLRSIFIGLPTWYMVGILVTLSPEFGRALGINGKVSAGTAIMYCYLGLVIGDLGSGLLSQYLKSRKKTVAIFVALTALAVTLYFSLQGISVQQFYLVILFCGVAVGYWAIFVTVAAEQFGTNLRATVATTVPNFARGALVPLSLLFTFLKESYGIVNAGILVGVVTLVITFLALWGLKETFDDDMNFVEVD